MKFRTAKQLRDDALAIWNAGVDGVRVDRLIRENVSISLNEDIRYEGLLRLGGVEYPLSCLDRIIVVGAGKASGAMAETLESILEPLFDTKEILGWVNVPEDCAVPLRKIRLHPARPMGVNEPTEAAVEGTEEMIRLLESLHPRDLCINLLSGGGSALLAAPVKEISLQDKLELTRFLSESGATIQQLNAVRKRISRIKGGGMKAMCRGKQLVSLILSDVLGDPLDVIASGPTTDDPVTASMALDILQGFLPKTLDRLEPMRRSALMRVVQYLETKAVLQIDPPESLPGSSSGLPSGDDPYEMCYDSLGGFVHNIIIGNNATAVEAAGEEAFRRGYTHAMYSARQSEATAEQVGEELVRLALDMQTPVQPSGPDCLIHGGEPVVRLAPQEVRGLGGRNQQLVLAALLYLLEHPEVLLDKKSDEQNDAIGFLLLSGGTDGEDGPTDAAGALLDPIVWNELHQRMQDDPSFNPRRFLETNDAYRFFQSFDALIKTGVTGTNVCDLRVVVVSKIAGS